MVVAILDEALPAYGRTGSHILLESSSIDSCALQTFTPVWVRGIGVWRETAYCIIVGLIKKYLRLFPSVAELERVITKRPMFEKALDFNNHRRPTWLLDCLRLTEVN